jgi:hypothetical protein
MNKRFEPLKHKCIIAMEAAFFVLSLGATIVIAQDQKSEVDVYRQPSQVPSILRGNYSALGDRLQRAGKERISISGILTNSSGTNPVQVIIEKGGKARVDIPSKSVRFNGKNVSTESNSDDEALLESIVDDLPETLVEAAASGAGLRLIGHRFKDPQGELCNIYDAWIPSKSNPKRQRPFKRYCFDSNTMMLSWIQYRDGNEAKAPLIETRFSDWIYVNGQAVPATITRIKGGIRVFALEAHEVNVSSKAEDGIFIP